MNASLIGLSRNPFQTVIPIVDNWIDSVAIEADD